MRSTSVYSSHSRFTLFSIANANPSYAAFEADHITAFHIFRHGMMHGIMAGLYFATSVNGVNALFERRGFMYIAVVDDYWFLSCVIKGGIVCAWH